MYERSQDSDMCLRRFFFKDLQRFVSSKLVPRSPLRDIVDVLSLSASFWGREKDEPGKPVLMTFDNY